MKKILVVDEHGVFLHSTYEKRARGLVKKGRAQFLNDTTIQFHYATSQKEVKRMSELTMQDVLHRIDQIHEESNYLKDAFMTIEKIPNNISDEQANARAVAASEMVKAKEETNRQMLTLLQLMFESVKKEEAES